jgi:hypothetical protein
MISLLCKMNLSVEAIDRELAELEKRFQQDRDDLLRARAYALRNSTASQPIQTAPLVSDWTIMSGKIPPTRSGVKTDRQIIREFLAGWTGEFTIQQLMDAAKRHEGSPAAAFDKNLWASTIFWLCRNRFLDVVKPRAGNKGGTYRVIVSRTDMVSPKRRKTNRVNPLQDIVIESIKNLTMPRFNKNDVIDEVLKNHPGRDGDVIGAVLHRLAANNVAARIFARSREGNVYEKL